MRRGHRFVFLLNLAQRRVQHWVGDRPGDLTAAHAGVLFVLHGEEGMLIGDVAKALDIGAPGASGLVARMEAIGLIERRPDDHDGRATRLFLTKKGRTVRTHAVARAAEVNARLVKGFTADELDVVARWLTHVGQQFAKGNGS